MHNPGARRAPKRVVAHRRRRRILRFDQGPRVWQVAQEHVRLQTRVDRGGSSAQRRVGRPRANGAPPSLSPREDILQAAGHLFAERGFLGTSTAQIAAAAGLRQSAIFHWFASKDSILETLFAEGWDRSLDYFARIDAAALRGAVKFCLCLTYDARLVAGSAPHVQLMIVPAELRQPRFRRLLRKRQRLIAYFEIFIRQAMRERDFRPLDVDQTARMVLAIDEVVLDVAGSRRPRSPQMHADTAVDFALHALVSDRRRIGAILRAARTHAAHEINGRAGPRAPGRGTPSRQVPGPATAHSGRRATRAPAARSPG